MEVLDNIERIERPSAARLRELVANARPFICTGVVDPSLTLASFADARIPARGRNPAMTVAEYMASTADLGRGSQSAKMPPALDERLRTSAPIPSPDTVVVMWLGRLGCKQRFHCDMDCAGIFLGQVHGTKRVCLVSPMQSQKVQPGLDRDLLLGEVPFHTSAHAEMLQFLRYAEGSDTILHEQEALYIPPLWWHYVEYLSDSLSVSWHTLPHPALVELSRAWPLLWKQEWPLWQGIVSRAVMDPVALDRARDVLGALARGEGGEALHALHRALCPDRYVRPYGDEAVFEIRRQRPLPWTLEWSAGDVPRVQPYIRFATVLAGDEPRALLVLDGHRLVGEVPLDEETAAVAYIGAALQERSGQTVAEIAAALDGGVADVCTLLAMLSEKGWVAK